MLRCIRIWMCNQVEGVRKLIPEQPLCSMDRRTGPAPAVQSGHRQLLPAFLVHSLLISASLGDDSVIDHSMMSRSTVSNSYSANDCQTQLSGQMPVVVIQPPNFTFDCADARYQVCLSLFL